MFGGVGNHVIDNVAETISMEALLALLPLLLIFGIWWVMSDNKEGSQEEQKEDSAQDV